MSYVLGDIFQAAQQFTTGVADAAGKAVTTFVSDVTKTGQASATTAAKGVVPAGVNPYSRTPVSAASTLKIPTFRPGTITTGYTPVAPKVEAGPDLKPLLIGGALVAGLLALKLTKVI